MVGNRSESWASRGIVTLAVAVIVWEAISRFTLPVIFPGPGTLEYFLTERYCLYTRDCKRQLIRGEIHHPPWPLQTAEAQFDRNTMAEAAGVQLPAGKPLLHFAKRQDVIVWRPERLP